MIRCACLLSVSDGQILLVRIRENDLWYLPGGTIEAGETPEQTLTRELKEELGVDILEESITFDQTVVGPALGRIGEVELNCFRASWNGSLLALAEVSEAQYVDLSRTDMMAPAVVSLVRALQQEGITSEPKP